MPRIRLFRGLAVPPDDTVSKIADIRNAGLSQGYTWDFWQKRIQDIDLLFTKPNLSLEDTRPANELGDPAICASGDELGAAYYAWRYSRDKEGNTPIVVEFEAELAATEIDGRDFLCTLFQLGRPERCRSALVATFGAAVLPYAECAWANRGSDKAIALCDLARHDEKVIRTHHNNRLVLRGRYGTTFRSAFIVKLPVGPTEIVRVWQPTVEPNFSEPDLWLDAMLER